MFEVFAPLFVAGVSDKPEVQGFMATFLPQLVNQLVGSVGWSARVAGGSVEDHYLLRLNEGVPERLSSPFEASGGEGQNAAGLFPRDVHQTSRYRFRDPDAAWRGLNAVIASKVDAYRASVLSLALEAVLKNYGIERPREFLPAAGPDIFTAWLAATSENKVLVVGVRDREALRRQVAERLGRGARTERVGGEELLISKDPEQGAASFVGEYLLVGDEEDLRRCLAARQEGRAAGDEGIGQGTSGGGLFDGPALVSTRTRDASAALKFVTLFGGGSRAEASRPAELEKALARHSSSVTETRLTADGFEKKTRSAFGQFGEIGAALAPGD